MTRRGLFGLLTTTSSWILAGCIIPNATGASKNLERPRLDFPQSVDRLRKLGLVASDENPKIPVKIPQYDDEELTGISIFKTGLDSPVDLSNLTMPRSYIGRSELNAVSFQNTDLSESYLCWNDFDEVIFKYASLDGADMRASNYAKCDFTNSSLQKSDMRRSRFKDCRFYKAEMKGAIVSQDQLAELKLSDSQIASLDIRKNPGPEPDGG